MCFVERCFEVLDDVQRSVASVERLESGVRETEGGVEIQVTVGREEFSSSSLFSSLLWVVFEREQQVEVWTAAEQACLE